MLILLNTTEHEAPYLVINKQPDANSSIKKTFDMYLR